MIIPISVACSGAMEPLRHQLAQMMRSLWLSHYSNRPGQLFAGAQNRLTILVASRQETNPNGYSTRYHRWDSKRGERENLFPCLQYQLLHGATSAFHRLLPKLGCLEAQNALEKIRSTKTVEFTASKNGTHSVFWVRVPGYFCQFLLKPPMAKPEDGGPDRIRGEVNEIRFHDRDMCRLVHAVLNSSTYYQFFCTYTDTRHINPSDVSGFPLDPTNFRKDTREKLNELSGKLTKCFAAHKTVWRKSGLLIDSIDSKSCKAVVDEIDIELGHHFGFTEDELDFIINYDIKYRMGQGSGEDQGE